MVGGVQALAAAALLAAATPLAAQAQNAAASRAAASSGTIGPILLPNRAGTIVYQSTGGTTVASGGTTVFHGTGPSATITIVGAKTAAAGGSAANR